MEPLIFLPAESSIAIVSGIHGSSSMQSPVASLSFIVYHVSGLSDLDNKPGIDAD
jgi:hypothetical protein